MTKRLLFRTPFQLADEKQTAIYNEHSTALSRDIFFLSLFCNKNSFSTEVYTFLEIYIYYCCYSSKINIDILGYLLGRLFSLNNLLRRISKMNRTDRTQISTSNSFNQPKQIQLRSESYKPEPNKLPPLKQGMTAALYERLFQSCTEIHLPKVARIFWQRQE